MPQAATRCLRQVPSNRHPARVYLTPANRRTLEPQLAETFGTSLKELDRRQADRIERQIVLHRPELPPLRLRVPDEPAPQAATVQSYTLIETADVSTRMQRVLPASRWPVTANFRTPLTPLPRGSRPTTTCLRPS